MSIIERLFGLIPQVPLIEYKGLHIPSLQYNPITKKIELTSAKAADAFVEEYNKGR